MLAVLEAFSTFVANNDGWGQRRLKSARPSQHASCDMLDSLENYDGRGQRRLNRARLSQHASCEAATAL